MINVVINIYIPADILLKSGYSNSNSLDSRNLADLNGTISQVR